MAEQLSPMTGHPCGTSTLPVVCPSSDTIAINDWALSKQLTHLEQSDYIMMGRNARAAGPGRGSP